MRKQKLSLFAAFGIELEYMIVDKQTLEILPLSEQILKNSKGQTVSEIDDGELAWSNELAAHILEIKNPAPVADLFALKNKIHASIKKTNKKLEKFNAMLLPSGMHPWTKSGKNIQLWPGEQNEIYKTYDRIFNCKGHGWFNVQSTHLNLPFANDKEFVLLHNAIRLVLPVLPALAASSPFVQGRHKKYYDNRLNFYGKNQKIVPEISGQIIPEQYQSIQDYKTRLLQNMYKAVAKFDTENVLQQEWLNSRGAIARFDRNAIEIRILDIQEAPFADICITSIVASVIKTLIKQNITQVFSTSELHKIYKSTVIGSDMSIIKNKEYLQLFGIQQAVSGREFWKSLLQTHVDKNILKKCTEFTKTYQRFGSLSSRILSTTGHSPQKDSIRSVYLNLSRCLAANKVYVPNENTDYL